ncbi:MAG: hypothetical protein ROO71_13410 [Balneola sp.]
MKNKLILLSLILGLPGIIHAQSSNAFSLSLGSISTQNSEAQPATSLSGQFEIAIPDNEENINIYLAVDISSYLAEGLRLSSCSDCSSSTYSGFDMGVKVRFESQKAKVPLNVFTGFSRVITKERHNGGTIPLNVHDSFSLGSQQEFTRSYLNHFWDLGIGLKTDFSQKVFFMAEVMAGYSLDSNSDRAQGIGKYEFNLGVGVRF